MAKSKNHTNHNQSSKNHRGGIRKIKLRDIKVYKKKGLHIMQVKRNRTAVKYNPKLNPRALACKARKDKSMAERSA